MTPQKIMRTLAVMLVLVLVLAQAPGKQLLADTVPSTPAEPVVAIHVSERTQTLETIPATSPTPTGPGTSGFEWWYTSWHYFVMSESLKEAFDSDGTPYVVVSDADIEAGQLLFADGSPRYPIVISLASEAIADEAVSPLLDYVDAGGFLFVGSSSFTRNPDGTTRGDFAIANEMGLHMSTPGLTNWYQNGTFAKVMDHRIVSHIPWGSLSWRMPLTADQIPWGVRASDIHTLHYTWQVTASGAEVIANGGSGPLLATKDYGNGRFIYHGAMQPIIGHGSFDSGMYAYVIYRSAVEWAFENANLPIVKVSPWRYPYDAAFVIRHDLENTPSRMAFVEDSAQVEDSFGAKGDYYLCTGTLRAGSEDDQLTEAQKVAYIEGLQRAVSLYGATIGSHNGGLPNLAGPTDPTHYHYWHWGTDEALDVAPEDLPPGYASAYEYAYSSVEISFADIEGWMAGLDNGRSGCGAAGDCPRTWVSPFLNSTREQSNEILEQLGSIIMGEKKNSPFPHWTVSYETPGARFAHVTLPTSDWYVGGRVLQSAEDGHTTTSVRNMIDFYYELGALINLYMHSSSTSGVPYEYVSYNASKPHMWAANAVDVYDWWVLRTPVTVTPSYSHSGSTAIASATISGATDPETAVEIVIPYWETGAVSGLEVYLDGAPAPSAAYRVTDYGVKVLVGNTVSDVEVHYTPLESWIQTDWSGGEGQAIWADETQYDSATGIDNSTPGQLRLNVVSGGDLLMSDDFTREPTPSPQPFNWIVPVTSPANNGVYTISGGVLESGTTSTSFYGFAYTDTLTIDNHSVEADIRFPHTGTFGGGLFGRLNAANGQRYSAWIYPEGSSGVPTGYGPAVIKLIKYYNWGSWNYPLGLQTASISEVGSDWHHLKMAFNGDQIQIFYDGAEVINVVDTNADGNGVYPSGFVGVDLYTAVNNYGPSYNNFIVRDAADAVVLAEDFGQDAADPLDPWILQMGSWQVVDGLLQGSSSASQYAYVYQDADWTDYTAEARFQFPSGAFGGGLGGRVNPATGAHYGAWIYPDGSSGGSNVLKLIKYSAWTTWSGTPMQQVSLPSVGTGWHTLKMAFDGNRIRVYYDGNLVIDVQDNNYEGVPAYLQGGVSIDMWTSTTSYVMSADDVFVRTPAQYGSSGTLLSSAFDGGVGVSWQNISWDAAAGGTTDLRIRTRTADLPDLLAAAPWSDWYGASGEAVASPDQRWIQYEVELSSTDSATTPILFEIGMTFAPGIVLPESNLTYTGPTSGDMGTALTLSALLLDDGGAGIAGRTINFHLADVETSGVTDGDGAVTAEVSLTSPPGTYDLTVSFAGDSEYAPVSITLPFTITSSGQVWLQESAEDFQANIHTGTDAVTIPGSVQLEGTIVGEGEESGPFILSGQLPADAHWLQTDWIGGAGQAVWADESRYDSATNIDDSLSGEIRLALQSDLLFGDDFTRDPAPPPQIFDWIVPVTTPTNNGLFNISDGILNSGTSANNFYGFAYTNTLTIDDHSVETDIRFPHTGTFGGGIFGRLDTASGHRYAAWVYPEGSGGVPSGYGPAVVKLIKYYNWGSWVNSPFGLAIVSIPEVGADWHQLKMTFTGSQIQVFYDGSELINYTDTDADGHGIFTSGYVGVDHYAAGNTYGPSYNNFAVRDTADTLVLVDDFGEDVADPLSPWSLQLGTWQVTDDLLQGSSGVSQYGYVYNDTIWTDYTVEARFQFPAGSFGGGLGGRVNPATGAHYGAWIYPDGSSGGSNVLKLIKYTAWTSWSGTPMQQVSLPSVGTGWHWLKMAFEGNRIRVYYDGGLVMDVLDENYEGTAAYLEGGVSVDLFTHSTPYVFSADDVSVQTLAAYPASGTLLSSAFDGGPAADWQTLSWDGTGSAATGLRLRTRTADELAGLPAATWSAWIEVPETAVTNPDLRWLQYEVEVTSSDPAETPTLEDITIAYVRTGSAEWGYRRRLFIDNNEMGELPAGYSVMLNLDTEALANEGKIRPDGYDLRVVWDNGVELVELDRIAKTPFNSTNSEIWFKTQAPIPGGQRDSSYFIYYGNADAGVPPTDPAGVWALWDGFDGSSLNTTLWNQPAGTVTLDGGLAQLAAGSNIIGITPFTYGMLEMRVQLGGENANAWWGWEEIPANASNLIIFEEQAAGFQAWTLDDYFGWPNYTSFNLADPQPGGLTAWHTYTLDWWPGNARWLIDGVEVASSDSNVPDSSIFANVNASQVPMNMDWVSARYRAAQEPTVTLATPQAGFVSDGQMLSMPFDTGQFSNWQYVIWDADTPVETSLTLRVRTAATEAGLATAPWQPYTVSGELIGNAHGRWVQYEADLATTDPLVSPSLHQVAIYYDATPVTLSLAPPSQTVQTGQAAVFTAAVTDGSQTWDVTAETIFSIESGAGGGWVDNVYVSEQLGTWVVTGEYLGQTATAVLQVQPAGEITCVTIQRGTEGIVDDSYVWEALPASNQATAYSLSTGDRVHYTFGPGETRTLIRYDLGAIPVGSAVDSATFGIQVSGAGSGETINLYRITAAWTEADGHSWNSIAESYDHALVSTSFVASGGEVTADLTDLVADWFSNGVPNYGVMLINGSGTARDVYKSSDYITIAQRPWLEVCYRSTFGTPTAIELSPADEQVPAGASVAYTATAVDNLGNRWDVTDATTFTLNPVLAAIGNGTCIPVNTWVRGWLPGITLNLTGKHTAGLSSITATPFLWQFPLSRQRLWPETLLLIRRRPPTHMATVGT